MRRFFLALVLACSATPAGATSRISSSEYLNHVKYLASDQLKGRGNTRPELEQAARYLEKVMERSGLKPFDSLGGYRQRFDIAADREVAPASFLKVGTKRYGIGKEIALLSFSDQPAGQAPAVFCGFGGASSSKAHEDCAGMEVAGKAMVISEGASDPGHHGAPGSDTLARIMAARSKGAAAVIVVVDSARPKGHHPEKMGVPAVAVPRSVALKLWGGSPEQFGGSEGPAAAEVSWSFTVLEGKRTISNVIGQIAPPGGASEWIVIGAHYDHLGLGERFSLDPKATGQPHYGADDNASGTAGILSLAPLIASEAAGLKRGVIFAAFAGEEMGLLGSANFVRHLPPEASKIAAMINMDMIGRVNGKIYISGVGTAKEFPEMIQTLISPLEIENSLHIEASQSSVSGSDHMSFTQRGIPALFFFSGLHSDYHRATDVWQKINSEAAVEVLEMVHQLIVRLAGSLQPLHYVSMPESRPPGSGSGYGAFFGSVPDFDEKVRGVRFSDVSQGGPADQAGLKRGDVLIKFDGRAIDNLYDFTQALRSHRAGDVVEVEVTRNGRTVQARVVLGKRN